MQWCFMCLSSFKKHNCQPTVCMVTRQVLYMLEMEHGPVFLNGTIGKETSHGLAYHMHMKKEIYKCHTEV